MKHYAGSFWSRINDDPLYDSILAVRATIERQTRLDAETLAACTSRHTTPLFRKVLLEPITLRQHKKLPDAFAWNVKGTLVSISYITDRIESPQVKLLSGVDFTVEDGIITFKDDPFDRFQKSPVYDDLGNHTADEVIVLAQDVNYDERYLGDIWGAPINVRAPSSEEYREALLATYDAMINGTTRATLERLVSASFDDCKFYPAYRVPDGEIASLTIPRTFLHREIGGDITLPNRDVPVTHKDGHIEFEVGGDPQVVERFRNKFHVPFLPGNNKTINPCKFVLENFYRNNVTVCVFSRPKVKKLNPLSLLELLRRIVPPHAALLLAERA